jgi:uncharacterized protein (TIGR03437 family)
MLRRTVASPNVMIGGASEISFSGLSPQFVGAYQLNVIVPASVLPADSVPLQIQIGGVPYAGNTTIVVGTISSTEWRQNSAHTSSVSIVG